MTVLLMSSRGDLASHSLCVCTIIKNKLGQLIFDALHMRHLNSRFNSNWDLNIFVPIFVGKYQQFFEIILKWCYMCSFRPCFSPSLFSYIKVVLCAGSLVLAVMDIL